jgi:hypothetical protein
MKDFIIWESGNMQASCPVWSPVESGFINFHLFGEILQSSCLDPVGDNNLRSALIVAKAAKAARCSIPSFSRRLSRLSLSHPMRQQR